MDVPWWEGADPRDTKDEKSQAAEWVLGLQGSYAEKDILSAYRKASLWAHPDKGGKQKDFLAVAEAKEALQAEKQGEGPSRVAQQPLTLGEAMRFMPGKGNAKKKKKTCKDPKEAAVNKAASKQDIAEKEQAKTCVAEGSSKPQTAAPPEPQAATWPASPVAAPAPTVEVKEEAKPEEAGVDVRDMTRCCFMNPELDAALKETQEQVSEAAKTEGSSKPVRLQGTGYVSLSEETLDDDEEEAEGVVPDPFSWVFEVLAACCCCLQR